MRPRRSSIVAATPFAAAVVLWSLLGDGSLWRTAAVALGGALITWALQRTLDHSSRPAALSRRRPAPPGPPPR